MELSECEETITLTLFVLTQCRLVTNRRTERQRDRQTDRQTRCNPYYPR